MRIGIDAHYVGVREGGNERHFENILRCLGRVAGGEWGERWPGRRKLRSLCGR